MSFDKLPSEAPDAPVATLRLPVAVASVAMLLAALAIFCIGVVSSARAYVGAESQYSKSQKAASHHLIRYAATREPRDWARYRAAMQVPQGYQRAREALDRKPSELEVARAGFLAGGTDAADVDGMIRLFRWFRQVPFMARAISIWAAADRALQELSDDAGRLHAAVERGDSAADVAAVLDRIIALEERLTPLQVEFSRTLGEASRQTQTLLTVAMLSSAVLLSLLGAAVSARVARREAARASALRESQARFHRAVLGSSDGFWDCDLADGRATLSPRFETLLGYGAGSLSASVDALKRLLHPEDRARARAAMSAHLRTGAPYDVDVRLLAADGQWRRVRSRARVQPPGRAGAAPLLAGSISDMTAQRAAEQALRDSEARFRSLWETTDDSVLIVGSDHVIRFANPAADRLFGHPAGALAGQPLAVVQPPGMRAAHISAMERYMATGERRLDWAGIETTARHADGHTFPIELRFAELDHDGESSFVGFMRDITRRKLAEAELLDAKERLEQRVLVRTRELLDANRRLEELDRLKSEFLATMSHELRTPLNSILGFTAVLREGLAGPLTGEQERQLALVHGSGEHLLALINDVLDLSRIESGRMEVAAEPFDGVDAAAAAVAQLRPLAVAKNLGLQLQMPQTTLPMRGDRRKLHQVLLNLAGNAIKFTERGGVTVAAAAVHGRLEVSVSDTGIGIAAEQLPTLFEPFRQIDGSLVRAHEGSGLGLYLCRKLLDLMGGDIDVESRPGVGSCFRFTLPMVLTTDRTAASFDDASAVTP